MLYKAEYEMTTDNGLIVTDLPESESKTTWQLDYSKTLKAINEAVYILDTSLYNRKDIVPNVLPEICSFAVFCYKLHVYSFRYSQYS